MAENMYHKAGDFENFLQLSDRAANVKFRETLCVQPGQLQDKPIARPIMKLIYSIHIPVHYFQNHARTAIIICVLNLLLGVSAPAADVSGEWEFAGKYFDDVSPARVTLKIDGEKLTGNLNELKLDGTLKGDEA